MLALWTLLPALLASSVSAQDGSTDWFVPNLSSHRVSAAAENALPVNYGMILFPAFQALDVFGPLDVLNMLSLQYHTNLTLIAETMDPVSTKPTSSAMNKFNSTFGESVLPTHTFDNAPPLDVLMIPGGLGTRAPNLNATIDFIRDRYPTVQYLVTICTGSWLAARAGVLDGKNATSNKRSWSSRPLGNGVNWIAKARWVEDGNIITSSGVSAGIDATLGFVSKVYGEEVAANLALGMEYDRHTDPSWDPFADYYNLTSTST